MEVENIERRVLRQQGLSGPQGRPVIGSAAQTARNTENVHRRTHINTPQNCAVFLDWVSPHSLLPSAFSRRVFFASLPQHSSRLVCLPSLRPALFTLEPRRQKVS